MKAVKVFGKWVQLALSRRKQRARMLERVHVFQEAVNGSIETEIRYNGIPFLYLGVEHDFYSAYWKSSLGASEFISCAKQYVSSGAECMMYTESRPENAYYKFEEVLESEPGKLDNECSFLRVFASRFDITWHRETASERLVGFLSNKLYLDVLNKIFKDTSERREEIPEEVKMTLEMLLEKFK